MAILSRNILIEGVVEDECYFNNREEEKLCKKFYRDTFGGHVKVSFFCFFFPPRRVRGGSVFRKEVNGCIRGSFNFCYCCWYTCIACFHRYIDKFLTPSRSPRVIRWINLPLHCQHRLPGATTLCTCEEWSYTTWDSKIT